MDYQGMTHSRSELLTVIGSSGTSQTRLEVLFTEGKGLALYPANNPALNLQHHIQSRVLLVAGSEYRTRNNPQNFTGYEPPYLQYKSEPVFVPLRMLSRK